MTASYLATSDAHHRLLQWFDGARRPFPWRAPDVSAWGVLVSEVMSQQTPMTRVEPVWKEWMTRWPKPHNLAQESSAEVVRAWGKLGYPRRALRLQECARTLATCHNDIVPQDIDTLLSLPGVGSYTAHAVACFAYGHNVSVVDTNVRRVVARVDHGHPDQGKPREKADLAEVSALLPADRATGARFSAALMEFGALVCTARHPHCTECILADSCAWVAAGQPVWDTATHGARPKPQKFTGTDRQVRGLLLDVVREHSGGVEKTALDVVWPDDTQRERALQSLLSDDLMECSAHGYYGLAGEHFVNETL